MSYNFEDTEDFVTDEEFINPKKKKKKVDGKKKGNRTELDLVKILNKRFGTGFSRSVGSGNRWSQVNHLPKHARDVFSGDLVVPEGFLFTIESKGGLKAIEKSGTSQRLISKQEGNYIETVNWKNCAVVGCKNGVSYRLNSQYCHPHSMGMMPISQKILEEEF